MSFMYINYKYRSFMTQSFINTVCCECQVVTTAEYPHSSDMHHAVLQTVPSHSEAVN
jgi:hypothetical protein